MAQRGNLFQNVKLRKPKTNGFNMHHQVLTTGNMGDLIPILCQEVIPGDIWRGRSEVFCRLMPMLAPVMQRVDIYTHYFFVPNRLLWNISKQKNSWQAFITGGEDGKQTPEPPSFHMRGDNMLEVLEHLGSAFAPCSLWDYFGLPTLRDIELLQIMSNPDNTIMPQSILLYPFLAYQLIYDEYYRDQNYTEPVLDSENMQGGGFRPKQIADLLTLRKRSWKKDYFTSSLPSAQRGEPVTFSLGDSAPVSGVIHNVQFPAGLNVSVDDFYYDAIDDFPNSSGGLMLRAKYGNYPNQPLQLGATSQGDLDEFAAGSLKGTASGAQFDIPFGSVNSEVYADLSQSTMLNVQMLREGLRLQEWLERNSVGGARYVEQIYAHFGVMVPDATIQRPIYLGGGKQTVRISEVLQSVDTENSPLGEMAGHGISVGRTHGFNNRKFTEHGFIIGILSVVPKASYMNGLSRMWTRFDKLDYYFPEFAHLGEQEVKVSELSYRWDAGEDASNRNNDTFGYQSRYAEYKYNEDRISGEFRTTLKHWHLGRDFEGAQFDNNADFLEIQPQETERIFAVQDNGATSKLLFQIYHEFDAIRPMPKFATPYI